MTLVSCADCRWCPSDYQEEYCMLSTAVLRLKCSNGCVWRHRRLRSVCQLFITSALSSVRQVWFQDKDSMLSLEPLDRSSQNFVMQIPCGRGAVFSGSVAIRYVMYFWFYGCHHVWSYWWCVEGLTFNLVGLALTAVRYRGRVWWLWMPCLLLQTSFSTIIIQVHKSISLVKCGLHAWYCTNTQHNRATFYHQTSTTAAT